MLKVKEVAHAAQKRKEVPSEGNASSRCTKTAKTASAVKNARCGDVAAVAASTSTTTPVDHAADDDKEDAAEKDDDGCPSSSSSSKEDEFCAEVCYAVKKHLPYILPSAVLANLVGAPKAATFALQIAWEDIWISGGLDGNAINTEQVYRWLIGRDLAERIHAEVGLDDCARDLVVLLEHVIIDVDMTIDVRAKATMTDTRVTITNKHAFANACMTCD